MGGAGNENMGYEHRNNEVVLNCSSSGMSINPQSEKLSGMTVGSVSVSMYNKSSCIGADPFLASGWDHPLVSLGQNDHFGPSSLASQTEFSHSDSPYPVQYLSYPNYTVPKLSCFGSGSFSEMVSSFDLPECGQISNIGCSSSYPPNKEMMSERASPNNARVQEDRQISEEGASGSSLNGNRRKRPLDSTSPFSSNKSGEGDLKVDPSMESSDLLKEQDEKKPKTEHNKGKQAKESSNSGEEPRENNYIHVRARRGQATNSHSLAERVRREKISERMRLLQELVPGCNKITGKAVMLDEIINYVQSLQQQVEFLSMKLATVNPELNIDIDRILSKDILQRGSSSIPGFGPGSSSFQQFPHNIFQLRGSLQNIPNSSHQFPPLSQGVLDNDLHSLLQMGFNSSSAIDNLGPNGRLKPEL